MPGTPILQLERIEVIYDQVILAVRGISLAVPQGGIVALLGANGAGKSTTLKAISSLVRAERGEVVQGRILFDGTDITHANPAKLAESGLVQVLEGRHCFGHLSVEENLKTGGFVRRPSRADLSASLEKIYHYFPRLKTRRHSLAGYTSGGEQQMVAIGRALMAKPRLILLDEPSMGLAPQIVEEIFEIVRDLNQREGVSFLLAEQNATVALRHASYGYVIENGVVATEGTASELAGSDALQASYLGGKTVASLVAA
ncbi:High-affinity branched-chain amino acid transport ATP-binding protein LivF [Andreprevotia sp. IGB-42]|uniref:ABC transporter ATP-binding protein n=1 Tax=Andreprevotia sp. IGB-42 TaxID=2497473 RepID=UPI00135AD654|nr:ABC transporter ATP-binding protein [Andreprevotia sp. IGB-42]KAF0815319.1 High-affinity branched-chain amino acid transport ATP-binding protein LivF [Andreprevotia sp. IGB-42]